MEGDRRRRTQSGTAMAEFALILPFLAMLVFATIDLGRTYSLQSRLANASREGAAFAQYFPGQVSDNGVCADPDNVTHHALGEDAGAASGFVVTVTNADTATPITGPCTTSGIAPGTRVKVTVEGTFTAITPFATQFIDDPVILRRSTTVVVQG
jgi:Flp pilus assembly pilin Flp